MDGFNLATLDSLPHGLPGNAQQAHGLIHGEITLGSCFSNACAQVVGETNAPRCAGGQLLARNDAIVEPTMNGRSRNSERIRCLLDRQQSTVRWRVWWLEPRNAPVTAKIADVVGGE